MDTLRTLIVAGTVAAVLWPAAVAAGPPSGQPAEGPTHTQLRHLRTVVIDPGHGGRNTGCLGVDGTFEKVLTLELAERIARILTEETSAAALLTRGDDTFLGLRERTRLANAWDADVFLSIHLNADPFGKGHGVETWFLAVDAADAEAERLVAKEEAAFAEEHAPEDVAADVAVHGVVQDAAIRASQAASEALGEAVARGMYRATEKTTFRGVKQARFGVLKEARMPAIVVEAGFFTHRDEGPRLLDPDHQEALARGIVDGLIAFDQRLGGERLAGAE